MESSHIEKINESVKDYSEVDNEEQIYVEDIRGCYINYVILYKAFRTSDVSES